MFDEKAMITDAVKGDLKAFELLIKRYERLVYVMVQRLSSDPADIEDICQEVFIRVYKGLPGFDFRSKLSTWIARIAFNTFVNYQKKHRKTGSRTQPLDTDDPIFITEDPGTLAERKEIAGYVTRLLAGLPANYRLVLTLYHLQGCSYEEISTVTSLPLGTVKGYLFRARNLLKDKLKHHLNNEKI